MAVAGGVPQRSGVRLVRACGVAQRAGPTLHGGGRGDGDRWGDWNPWLSDRELKGCEFLIPQLGRRRASKIFFA